MRSTVGHTGRSWTIPERIGSAANNSFSNLSGRVSRSLEITLSDSSGISFLAWVAGSVQKSEVMILHVEDNELVVSYVRRMLELKGWRVESCMDGEVALRKIEGESQYDLIILDQQLPGVSGLKLLRRAHSLPHRRQTPVVMYTCSDLEREALASGANAFVGKDRGVNELVQTIVRLKIPRDQEADQAIGFREG